MVFLVTFCLSRWMVFCVFCVFSVVFDSLSSLALLSHLRLSPLFLSSFPSRSIPNPPSLSGMASKTICRTTSACMHRVSPVHGQPARPPATGTPRSCMHLLFWGGGAGVARNAGGGVWHRTGVGRGAGVVPDSVTKRTTARWGGLRACRARKIAVYTGGRYRYLAYSVAHESPHTAGNSTHRCPPRSRAGFPLRAAMKRRIDTSAQTRHGTQRIGRPETRKRRRGLDRCSEQDRVSNALVVLAVLVAAYRRAGVLAEIQHGQTPVHRNWPLDGPAAALVALAALASLFDQEHGENSPLTPVCHQAW